MLQAARNRSGPISPCSNGAMPSGRRAGRHSRTYAVDAMELVRASNMARSLSLPVNSAAWRNSAICPQLLQKIAARRWQ
jgi:hypothetical protein